jgi:CheY-like chemotaxis protein
MEETWQTSTNTHPHIVLADDDSDDRELFEEAVTVVDPRIKISMAKDGEELMELLKTNSTLDMIFLDLNMPKKNGKECLTEIMESNILKNIPVIIYTTSLNPDDIEETFNHGAHHFFRKPNSYEELKNILHKLLRDSRPHSQPRVKETFLLNGNR